MRPCSLISLSLLSVGTISFTYCLEFLSSSCYYISNRPSDVVFVVRYNSLLGLPLQFLVIIGIIISCLISFCLTLICLKYNDAFGLVKWNLETCFILSSCSTLIGSKACFGPLQLHYDWTAVLVAFLPKLPQGRSRMWL